ncbi:MAG: MBL fold metallo-hydrolase [Actinobacteria bacterium]|nr:MAG: MBL fold metallo-hydrolase [Actinomycetota bacterium]
MTAGPQLTFHGVRGSTPCDGRQYERYGGNTSCVSLELAGHDPIIFDLGTGARAYGDVVSARAQRLIEANAATPFRATVFLTHLHWDHVIGLPFFTPVFRPDAVVDVYGPAQPEGLGPTFTGLMSPPYFPITPAQLGGTIRFHDTSADEFALDGAKVRTRWVRHTDPALGFRVELGGGSVTYISDHAQGCCPDEPDDYVPEDVLELCDGVDVVVHDAQHTNEEFEVKRHFGHCTVEYALLVAREAGAKQVVLFHHCPTHSDDNVDVILRDARDLADRMGAPPVVAAYEGMRLRLGER